MRDLALLEGVDLALSPRLNVISGETGEGKSLLLAAILLLLGERARKGLVRSGSPEAVVEGRFLLTPETLEAVRKITDLVAADAEELCLRRVISEEGQSRAYLDGSLCPIGVLQKLARVLVDLHGQGDGVSLQRPQEQALVLDRFGGHEDQVSAYRALHREIRTVCEEESRLCSEREKRDERLEFLRYQMKDLEALRPLAGEEERLAQELRKVARSEDLRLALQDVIARLSEGKDAVDSVVSRLARNLSELAPVEPRLVDVAERLRNLASEASELARTSSSLQDSVPAFGAELQSLEDRLSAIHEVARRLRVEPSRLAERWTELKTECSALSEVGERENELAKKKRALTQQLVVVAKDLLVARRKAAKRLEPKIKEGLAELRMEKARIRIGVSPEQIDDDFDPMLHGEDGPGPVQFYVAANPGEPEQPMEKVASGGEMARILLALKSALAGAHRTPLLVFDEIDAGVGGRVGQSFGRRIAAIAKHHQVLVITHLAQVAAFADRHFRVAKRVHRGRTRTEVFVLEGDERVKELAEMLGGDAEGPGLRAQAKALLAESAE